MLQFVDFADTIAELSHLEASNVFNTMASLSASITSIAIVAGATFPNLTLSHFEVLGTLNNNISKALQVSFAPLVKRENILAWETYANDNQGWIDESLALAADYLETDHHDGGNHTNYVRPLISPNIFRFEHYTDGKRVVQLEGDVEFGQGNYAPVWQQAPAPHDPSIINFDLLSHPVFARVVHGMWETQTPVLSEVTDLTFLDSEDFPQDDRHPRSFLLNPIYPSFDVRQKDDVAGILVGVVDWNGYFSSLLQPGASEISVVLLDSCGDSFTYNIEGPEAIFLGKGELHDPKYDHLVLETKFAPFLHNTYSDLHEHCEYDLRIFPTAKTEAGYKSNKPLLYAFVVVLIFFCTAMVFALYDYTVNLRQQKVMAQAKRTHAIVSSLFPSNVRDRMLKEAEQQAERDLAAQEDNKKRVPFASNKSQLKDFLGNKNSDNMQSFDTKPIADLFPSATVMVCFVISFGLR